MPVRAGGEWSCCHPKARTVIKTAQGADLAGSGAHQHTAAVASQRLMWSSPTQPSQVTVHKYLSCNTAVLLEEEAWLSPHLQSTDPLNHQESRQFPQTPLSKTCQASD